MPRPRARIGIALAGAVLLTVSAPAQGRAPKAQLLARLNEVRAAHGAPPLRPDPRLALAARRHSRDLVARRYFSHDSRTGERFWLRIARTGWIRSHPRWSVGETLAWGIGSSAQPRSVVAAWLASPPHRRIVLAPRFRLVGTGIAEGTPFGAAGAGRTFTADFGS